MKAEDFASEAEELSAKQRRIGSQAVTQAAQMYRFTQMYRCTVTIKWKRSAVARQLEPTREAGAIIL